MLSNVLRLVTTKTAIRSPVLSSCRLKSGYEGEGKTTVRVINQEEDAGLMIDAYATYGFRLNNGVTVLGPMVIFPRTVLSWSITRGSDITTDSLKLFTLLTPKIDLIIMGLDSSSRETTAQALKAARSLNLNVEVLPTEHAASTFNFLSNEGRCVAAALLPPLFVSITDDDLLQSQRHYNSAFTAQTE